MPLAGRHSCGEEPDFFALTLEAGQALGARLTPGNGTTCDTVHSLRLLAPDGTTVLADDGGIGHANRCARISPALRPGARALPAGTYFVELRATELRDYRLTLYALSPADEPDDTVAQSQPSTAGSYWLGELEDRDDVDWFDLDLSGHALPITVRITTGLLSCPRATNVTLLDDSGQTETLPSRPGICQRIEPEHAFEALSLPPAHYRVRVNSASPNLGSPGHYEIGFEVELGDDQEPNDSAATAPDFPGNALRSWRLSPGDTDLWAVELSRDGLSIDARTFDAEGRCMGGNTLELLAPDGSTVLASSSEHRLSPDSCGALVQPWARGAALLDAGRYFLRVTPDANEGTDYLLFVEEVEVAAPWEIEPNDAPSEAHALAASAPVFGTAVAGDTDVFLLHTPPGGASNVTVFLDDGFGDCDRSFRLALLEADGTTLRGQYVGRCDPVGPFTHAWTRNLAGDSDYYLRLTQSGGSGDYLLSVAYDDLPWEAEPNDEVQDANGPITGNARWMAFADPTGEVDWYELEITQPQTLIVSLTPRGNALCDFDADLRLYDDVILFNEDALWQARGANAGTSTNLCTQLTDVLTRAGRYFVEVRAFFGTRGRGPYDLHIELEPPPAHSFETEPNNTALQAEGPISPPGETYQATLADNNDEDWFELVVTQPSASMVIETSDGAGDCAVDTILAWYQVDDQGNLSLHSEADDNGPGLCSRMGIIFSPGRNYFKVYGYRGATGPYQIEFRQR